MRIVAFLLSFLLLLPGFPGWGASNDSLNTILDLEAKITEKVRAIIHPVDPDAIVITKVTIQVISTELAGTQMSAVGIMSTADVQSVEEKDIQSVTVSILTAMDPFPEDILKLANETLRGFSKKGQVKMIKMTDSMAKSIVQGGKAKNELLQKSKTGWEKATQLAEQLTDLTKKIPEVTEGLKKNLLMVILQLLVAYSLIQGALLFFQKRFQKDSIQSLRQALGEINLNTTNKGGDEATPTAMPMPMPGQEGGSVSGKMDGSITTQDNPIDKMFVPLVRRLLADCYWCERDQYAAWIWAQLSPPKRVELLESWEPLLDYVRYITRLDARTENYHLDPSYLKAGEDYILSNEDLLAVLRKNPAIWSEMSSLRQKSVRISLKERLDFITNAKDAKSEANFAWPKTPSPLRVLQTPLDIGELTLEDEEMILENPEVVPEVYRGNLDSLIWLAMLPREEREKMLQRVPAQSLAEVWVGPESVLEKIREVLPPKKLELLNSYVQKVNPSRTANTMKSLTEMAVKRLRELKDIPVVNTTGDTEGSEGPNQQSA